MDDNTTRAETDNGVESAQAGTDLTALLQGSLSGDPFAAVAAMVAGVRSDLAATSYEGVAGGGVVRVTLSGEKRLTSISIAQEVLATGEASLVEELIVAAAGDAFEKANAVKGDALHLLDGLLGQR